MFTLYLKNIYHFFFHLHILLLSLLSARSHNKPTDARILEFIWRPNIGIRIQVHEIRIHVFMFEFEM